MQAFLWAPELDQAGNHIVPAILVYADLIADAIARNVETVKTLYDGIMEPILLRSDRPLEAWGVEVFTAIYTHLGMSGNLARELCLLEFVAGPCDCLLRRVKNLWLVVVGQHRNGRGGLELSEHGLRFRPGQIIQQSI